MYCCSAQDGKMDYKRRFLLGGSKQKVQQHQQYQMPEIGRALCAPVCSTPAPIGSSGGCGHAPSSPSGGMSTASAVADIQQGISKYLDALNVFCRASAFLMELFSGVFRSSHYSKAAMQLKDVQEHVTEAASRLTAAIKPEIAKMLMELSTGAASFREQSDFSLQDVEVLGRCFLTVMQVHFQFLSQALQKVQPVAQSCLAEALAQAQECCTGGVGAAGRPQGCVPGALSELEEAIRSWKGAAEATARLRERGRDSCLAGLQVQQLFCSHSPTIPEHQLKELNVKIDHALQAYKVALESLGHSEYALKAGFHLSPKAAEDALLGCCSEAEAQQAGHMQTPTQPVQCELPTIPLQIGSHFLKGVSFNESAADNLKLKTHAMLQLLKEAVGQNGQVPRDSDYPVTEILNQVCPSSWRGACKTAVQLLFGQAGLVSTVHREIYLPDLIHCREQALPAIQVQLLRETSDLPHGSGSKSSSGLPKTISKITSKLTKKVSSSGGGGSAGYSIPSTPSRCLFPGSSSEDKPKPAGLQDGRLPALLQSGNLPASPDPGGPQLSNGCSTDDKGMNLPTDQEMQDVIDFLSGFNMGKSQQASPLVQRRTSVASAGVPELRASAGPPPSSQTPSHGGLQPSPQSLSQQQQSHQTQQPSHPAQPQTQQTSHQQSSQPALQYYQHLLQPLGQHQQPLPQPLQQQRVPSKWLGSPGQHPPQVPPAGLSPLGPVGQWSAQGLPDLSSDLYSLGLVSSYMDSVMSEMLGQKAQGPRNNTWPNRDQTEGAFGMLGDTLPFDPAVGSDPEFARYVAGVNQAMQQKRQAQHLRRPSNARSNWPMADEPHRTWPHPDYYAEGDAMSCSWSTNQGDSASSSDETSSANGDSLFSMFSGPDLVAAVKQRRKHSCGEPEVCTLPSPPTHHCGNDSNQDSKTKTWPPKAPWQHSAPHMNTLPNPSSSLFQMSIPSSQWSDTMQLLQSQVWCSAGDGPSPAGLSPVFPFAQQQQQQPPPPASVSQRKPVSKGFKSFPLKHEHRPSYQPQF
uniref:Granule associated Rac and RHOG effector 1 n=1 Tax=Scleropages formosus TaxID=113540 RepID=A0A8C9VWU5_SCLFO